MKLKYIHRKGSRTNYYFIEATAIPLPADVCDYEAKYPYVYNTKTKKWVFFSEYQTQYDLFDKKNIIMCKTNGYIEYKTSIWCHSIRAFRRQLKKAPAGVKFNLVSRYINQDVQGVGTCKTLF